MKNGGLGSGFGDEGSGFADLGLVVVSGFSGIWGCWLALLVLVGLGWVVRWRWC